MEVYSCKNCINLNSPLCDVCVGITTPGGKKIKPTYFVEKNAILKLRNSDAGEKIKNNINERMPIPVLLVLKYNSEFQNHESTREG